MSGELNKLLEKVAREAKSACDGYPGKKGDDLVFRVLKASLLPLLEAGQKIANLGSRNTTNSVEAWYAAFKKAMED